MRWRDDVVRHRTCIMCGTPYYGDLGRRNCPSRIKPPEPPEPPAVTDWFPPHIKPARTGRYEVRDMQGRVLIGAIWDGRHWRVLGLDHSIIMVPLEWRGLAQPAAEGSTHV